MLPQIVEQDPKDVVYALFFGRNEESFSSERLTVVQRETIRLLVANRLIEAEVAIIGESHYVVLRDADGRIVFAELLACVDLEERGLRPAWTYPLRHLPPDLSIMRGVLDAEKPVRHVHFDVRLRRPSKDRTLFVPRAHDSTQPCVQLEVAFPGPLSPRTLVLVERRESGIRIKTLHEYTTPLKDAQHVEALTTETMVTFTHKESA